MCVRLRPDWQGCQAISLSDISYLSFSLALSNHIVFSEPGLPARPPPQQTALIELRLRCCVTSEIIWLISEFITEEEQGKKHTHTQKKKNVACLLFSVCVKEKESTLRGLLDGVIRVCVCVCVCVCVLGFLRIDVIASFFRRSNAALLEGLS